MRTRHGAYFVEIVTLRLRLIVLLALGVIAFDAWAHDPSAYGGLFRSRNYGATWLNADVGLFLGAAVSLTIDPKAPEHLYLGTDTGLLESTNGGRKWTPFAADKLFGAVFAVQFSPEGDNVLLTTPAAAFYLEAGAVKQAHAPTEAAPARAIAFGESSHRAFLLGRRNLFVTEDAGRNWSKLDTDLTERADVTELKVTPAPRETLFVIASGKVMSSSDGGKQWQARMQGIDSDKAEGLSLDGRIAGRLWVASSDQIYISNDAGATWQAKGQLLPEPGLNVRAIVSDPDANNIVIATHKGLYRSVNGGGMWALIEDNLPVHLDSRPLMHDPSAPGTIYAGFALMPYPELWRIAVEGGNLLSRIDPVSLAGGLSALALLLLGGVLLARRLFRTEARAPSHNNSTGSP